MSHETIGVEREGAVSTVTIDLTGDFIDAKEAHRIGLVVLLADEGEHLQEARDLAERMARWSPLSLRLIKRSVRAAHEVPLSAGLELEKELFLAAFASEEGREGILAFAEKRDPEFQVIADWPGNRGPADRDAGTSPTARGATESCIGGETPGNAPFDRFQMGA